MITSVRVAEHQRQPDDILILDVATDLGDAIVEVDALDKDLDLTPARIANIITEVRDVLEAVQGLPLSVLRECRAEFERKRGGR